MKSFIKWRTLPILSCALLVACGYKGDLYLPKENDKNQFGVIQTGLEWESTSPKTQEPHFSNQPQKETE